MSRLSFILFYLSIFFASSNHVVTAQGANDLLRAVNQKFARVKDYQADVNIKADIPFVRMLPVQAHVYFRQPDQFRLKSKGIALLPKQGIDRLITVLKDTNSYTAILSGSDLINNIPVSIINVIPLQDTSDLVLGKLWIDGKRSLIIRSQVTSKTNGTVVSDYEFGKLESFALPDRMTFTIDTRKFKIPKAISADLNNVKSAASPGAPEKQKGKIHLTFSNYIVNKGIPESVFSQKDN